MKFSITATLVMATGVLSAGSNCPLFYPVQLNSTNSLNDLIFVIGFPNDTTIDNRAIQLRPTPISKVHTSQARNEANEVEDLGPTAYLNQTDEVDGTTRYSVGFTNATQWPGEIDLEFSVSGGSYDGTYYLSNFIPLGNVGGFLLCDADTDLENGDWYQIFYETYSSGPYEFSGCQSVGVRATVAAYINNAACDIGGYVAF